MMVALTLWSVTYALELSGSDLATKQFWLRAEYPGLVFIPVLWLIFTLQYSDSRVWETYRRRTSLLLFLVPVVTLTLALTNTWHHLIWRKIELDVTATTPILALTYGGWFWVHVLVSYIFLTWGAAIIVNMAFRTRAIYRRQALVILSGFLIPWAGNILYLFGPNPVKNVDPTPFMFTVTGIVLAWAVFKYRLLHIMPVALRAVFDGMEDGVIVLDVNNCVIDMNPGVQDLIGISTDEAIGKDAGEVFSHWPEQVDRFREVMSTRTEITLDVNGETRQYGLFISPLVHEKNTEAGRVLVFRNTTEHKQSEMRWERQLRFLQALNRIGDTVISEMDRQQLLDRLATILGETLEVDRSLIYDARIEDEVAQGLCEWLNPDRPDISATKATCPVQAFQGGLAEMGKTEHWLQSHFDAPNSHFIADGSAGILHEDMCIKSLLWFPFAFRVDGYFVLVINQVTHRRDWLPDELTFLDAATRQISLALQKLSLLAKQKKTREELTVSNQNLSDAMVELQTAQTRLVQRERLAAVGQLAAGIAHDFNNILTGIIGYAELLRTAPDIPKDAREDLGRIKNSGSQAARLVEQLLDFSRQSFRQPETLEINPFLTDAIQFLRRIVPENIHLSVELEPERFLIHADKTQLQQLITNLVLNAKDAMPEGGEMRVSASHQSIVDSRLCAITQRVFSGDWIVLRFSDTGQGISPDVIPRVLEPFYTTKAVGKGSGMGLSQVAGIVDQHDGHLTIETDPETGTTFSLYFPPSAEENCSEKEVDPETLTHGKGQTVLLVEDDEIARDASRDMLERLHYNVLVAVNGKEAVKVYADNREKIHVVLSDVIMPEMDGIQLFDTLRSTDPGVSVIMMSGYLMEDKREDLLSRGVVDWLHKPMTLQALSEVIARAM